MFCQQIINFHNNLLVCVWQSRNHSSIFVTKSDKWMFDYAQESRASRHSCNVKWLW